MVEQAKRYIEKGVYGINLLGYRFVGDAVELNKRVASEINAPLCIAGSIDAHYICLANKPQKDGYERALDMLELYKNKVIVIGDQIFTDILGANRSGIASILVKFIQIDKNAKIGKKRKIEKIILNFYKKNKYYTYRLGNVKKEENVFYEG